MVKICSDFKGMFLCEMFFFLKEGKRVFDVFRIVFNLLVIRGFFILLV